MIKTFIYEYGGSESINRVNNQMNQDLKDAVEVISHRQSPVGNCSAFIVIIARF